MRVIVTLSGGLSSAWCAWWALREFPRKDVVLYFNDTKWEHPDLYRFLSDFTHFLQHPLTEDSDGRTPEQLFYDNRALANNLMPFCSRVLKANRLQSFFQDGDVLLFGIDGREAHRAQRIETVYTDIGSRTNRWVDVRFPIIEAGLTKGDINTFFMINNIRPPALYSLGFEHNNCSGGCVRAGKTQWVHLYRTLPDVYADRERVEEEMRKHTGRDIHFLKNETLRNLRLRADRGELSRRYEPKNVTECVGVCGTFN